MSHTATVQVEIKDPKALEDACKKLGVEFHRDEEVQFYDRSRHRGMTARLPGWKYPVVFKDGQVFHDSYEGSWGEMSELNKLKQRYSATVAAKKARQQGFRVQERVLSDGRIRLTCQKG